MIVRITLISKCDDPIMVNQFGTITFCNMAYKVVKSDNSVYPFCYLILSQSSLTNIHGYIMQTCNIPVSICECICRNLIWGSTTD